MLSVHLNRSPRLRGRLAALLGVGVVTALLATGCSTETGGGEALEPVAGGNLTVQITGDPQTLDELIVTNPNVQLVASQVFERLFERDANLVARPALVDEYEVEDGTLYTFTLREGVTFHDGTPLTTADVVATLNRWLATSAGGKATAVDVEAVEAVDELTFTIQLKQPRYALLAELASAGTYILKADVVENAPAEGFSRSDVVGTGPYQLESWDEQRIVLTRFDDYAARTETEWGGGAGQKIAYLDTVTFEFVANATTVMNGLTTGLWDYGQPQPDEYANVEADPNLQIHFFPGANLATFAPNSHESSVFSDVRAREALNLVMNKAEIAIGAGDNEETGILAGSFVHESYTVLHSDEGKENYEAYDPERAKELFEEAGVDANTELRIITSSTYPLYQRWAVLLQGQLEQIGVKARVDSYDFAAMLTQLTNEPETWDIAVLSINGDVVSPTQMSILSGRWGSWRTPELGAAITSYNAALTEEEAQAAVDAIQGYIWENYSFIVAYQTRRWIATTTDVHVPEGWNSLAMWGVWKTPEESAE